MKTIQSQMKKLMHMYCKWGFSWVLPKHAKVTKNVKSSKKLPTITMSFFGQNCVLLASL
jgi:hypothetical protein